MKLDMKEMYCKEAAILPFVPQFTFLWRAPSTKAVLNSTDCLIDSNLRKHFENMIVVGRNQEFLESILLPSYSKLTGYSTLFLLGFIAVDGKMVDSSFQSGDLDWSRLQIPLSKVWTFDLDTKLNSRHFQKVNGT